jgi:hypothetical protein
MATAELFAVKGAAFAPLSGIKGSETIVATAVTAPSTAPASYAAIVNGSLATPTCSLSFQQTAPALSNGGSFLQSYATAAGGADAPTQKANSVMVARQSVLSVPLATPSGATAGLITFSSATPAPAAPLTAGANVVVAPNVTALSQIRFYLMAAGAGAAIVYPTISAFAAGTGFTATVAAANTWGYDISYA